MTLHEVHNHGNAQAVGFVNELLEFIGCAESAGGCKEVGDVIAETAVVGMLLNGHHLNAVVAVAGYAW